MNPKGVAAIVTGGASGLGAATAERLASDGARVTIFDMNEDTGRAQAAKIGGAFIKVNVTDQTNVAEAVMAAEKLHGVARILVSCAGIASAAKTRLQAAEASWAAAADFKPVPLKKGALIGLGALVEVEDGDAGKTLFVAPAGAGEELTGPDGDGFLHVVTPGSPLGKAIVGRKVGDVVEVMVKGELAEWDIVFAA